MSLTLLTAVSATQTTFDILGSDDLQSGDFRTIDSETIVIVTANHPALAYGQAAYWRVGVVRGSGGTRRAAHAANATVGVYSAGGGGAISVTDGTTTVDPASSLSLPKGAVTSPGGGVAAIGGLLVAEAALTDANIKGLGSGTVVDVVGAPGVGKVVVPFLAFVTVDATAAPYTGINAGATIELGYDGGSDASTPLNEGFTAAQVQTLLGVDSEVSWATLAPRSDTRGNAAVYDASEGENLPVGITGWNGGDGDFTGGNAANTGRVKVFYTIEDLI